MSEPSPTTPIPLPDVTVQRADHRGGPWEAGFKGIVGRGRTQREARAALGAQLVAMAETISVAPAFARDGSGTVAMALARPWGLELYRISPLFARHAGIATPHPEGPVAYLGSIAQYVPLPESAATNSGDGPEEVYTREEVAAALTAGVEAAQENTNDHASLKVVEAATLARLRNPLAQVPPPDPSVTEEDGHTVTVHVRLWGPRAGWYCEYSALPGRLLGPWTSDTVITDLIESAGMAYEDAYALVEGNVDGTRVTVNTRR